MSRWESVKLEKAVEFAPKVSLKKDGLYAFVGMEDINPIDRHVHASKMILYDGTGGAKFTNDSILFARITPCLENRKIAQVKLGEYTAGIGSTEFLVFREKQDVSDLSFLYYLLKSDFVVENAINSMVGASGRQRADWQYLKGCKVPLPPLPTQRRIAEVLGRYDALIDNYQKQISTLEGMAQELYREWFMRGRCPYAEPGEDGGLPVGWETKMLGDVAIDARQIVKVQDLNPETAYVGLEHLSIKSIVIKDCGKVEDIDSDKLLFQKNDILFGKIRAYLHKVCLSHFDGICSSDTIVIRPKIDNALGYVLFTVFDNHFIEFADKVSNGTKMPRSEWSVLKTYKVIVPTDQALQAFDKIAVSIFDKIANLQTQLMTLRQTRDALLPRLLSGQLTVSDTVAEPA